jgi:ubiquinone biosynthesis protein
MVRGSHQRRYREIANALARHGLGYLVGVLGLDRLVPFHWGLLGHPRRAEPYTRPEHVRMALEDMGAAFIKLGQILSSRPDLLPPEYQIELGKLQDAAPTVSTDVIREILAGEFDQPIECVFASFDSEPLAAASIGQAHAATLRNGTEVVVKIRRPGALEQVEQDLDILQGMAAAAARRWEVAERYDVVGLAQEFAQTLQAELDYIREGRNAERFAENFADDPSVHIPAVFWDQTTARVLTLERIRGIKIDDISGLDAAGIDRRALAQQAARVILKMVFEDGFFHADPHAGNFFVERKGRLGLIDFGMVGMVDQRTQEQLVALLLATTSQEADRLVDAFLDLGSGRRKLDRELLRRDFEHLLSRYYGRSLGEIALGPLLQDALAVVRRHRLQLPSNLALLTKTVVMHEGLEVQLDPELHLMALLAPYAEQLMLRQYSPVLWAGRLRRAGLDMAAIGIELPRQLHRLIGDIERGGIEVGMRPEGFEPFVRRFERLGNRIAMAIFVAAMVNALALLITVYQPPGWEKWVSIIFAVGFAVAAGIGLYLAWRILRTGRG